MLIPDNIFPVEHCVRRFAMLPAGSHAKPSILETYGRQGTCCQPHFVHVLSSSASWGGQGMATCAGRTQTLMESLMRSNAAQTKSAARYDAIVLCS